MSRWLHIFVTVFFGFLLMPEVSSAQVITETQSLSFGTIAIRNLTDNVSLNIENNGTCTPNANTYIIDPCTRGEFSITGFAPSSVYTVTTPVSTTLSGAGPDTFVMDNFRVRPTTLVTDGSGADTFQLMARITSSGGDTFGEGNYNDTFNITLNF